MGRSIRYRTSSTSRVTGDAPLDAAAKRNATADSGSTRDLQYLENDLITQYKVHFRYDEFDGDWSGATARTINTPDARCSAGQDVHLTVL